MGCLPLTLSAVYYGRCFELPATNTAIDAAIGGPIRDLLGHVRRRLQQQIGSSGGVTFPRREQQVPVIRSWIPSLVFFSLATSQPRKHPVPSPRPGLAHTCLLDISSHSLSPFLSLLLTPDRLAGLPVPTIPTIHPLIVSTRTKPP